MLTVKDCVAHDANVCFSSFNLHRRCTSTQLSLAIMYDIQPYESCPSPTMWGSIGTAQPVIQWTALYLHALIGLNTNMRSNENAI